MIQSDLAKYYFYTSILCALISIGVISISLFRKNRFEIYIIPLLLINTVWQLLLLGNYFERVIYNLCIITTNVMLFGTFLLSNRILETYSVLDQGRFTSQFFLRCRVIGAIGVASTIALEIGHAIDRSNGPLLLTEEIVNGIVAVVYLGYDTWQVFFLLNLIFFTKSTTKPKLKRKQETEMTLTKLTILLVPTTIMDWCGIILYFYDAFILPTDISIYPFAMNIAGLHVCCNCVLLYGLQDLAFGKEANKRLLSVTSRIQPSTSNMPMKSTKSKSRFGDPANVDQPSNPVAHMDQQEEEVDGYKATVLL